MLSVTTVIQYIYKHRQIQMQADSVVQVRTVLLTSDFGSSTRGEWHNLYYADHTIWPHQLATHLVMFKGSVNRDPKKLNCCRNGRKLNSMAENSNLCPNGRKSIVCLHGPMSTFNWLFLKSSNSQPISPGHDVIQTPASFPVWGLLWQWWLSYPLRTSVKLYPVTV